VLFAESAVLVHFKSVGVVLLVFHCVVVALLAFCASECDFNSHNGTSRFTEIFFSFTLRKSVSLPLLRAKIASQHHILWYCEKHTAISCALGKMVLIAKKKNPLRGVIIIA
jgi:hypothetical protein